MVVSTPSMSIALGNVRLPVIVQPHNKYRVGVAASLSFVLLYALTNTLQWRSPTLLAPGWLDTAMPLVPATVWVYGSFVFVVIFAFMLERDCERLSRFLYAQIAVNLVSALVFVLWPTTILRPVIVGADSLSIEGLRFLYLVDAPVNCFPSLHVSTTLLPVLMMWKSRPRLRMLFLLWVLAIAVSTITTKQHHVADVAGGALMAAIMYWIFFWTQPSHAASTSA